ncbi:hypothetical protein PR202_ga23382 [Eleusine coracana subsp. coracana]|uniref:rRNA N-glycosylase n=1 Tax=Eleusine coracana subsp. coracana TaxID=191504 RepID=A0AAV5D6A6_ELECO|nr:hypothetical protein QOZ80_1AG0010680 [Eleusine coracana subsp. coracana]GJN05723.1 hypothetical protein PR202_ga23382 [Eleusine coracana subsp. coracana]
MARDPEFTVDFHVESNDNYGRFIANLRHRLANPRHFSHNRPVLPPVEPDASQRRWFHVVLRTSTAALTLATRADNLYLEGFLSEDGTWWELNKGVIPGATYMGFGGSYGNLLGQTDNLAHVTLGPKQMKETVNELAARVPADLRSRWAQRQAGMALARLLLMVHEATRFATLSRYVAELMHPRAAEKSGTITAEMIKKVHGWEDLSTALLKADAQRPSGLFTPVVGVNTTEEAANTVGILLFVEVPGCRLTADAALKLFRAG